MLLALLWGRQFVGPWLSFRSSESVTDDFLDRYIKWRQDITPTRRPPHLSH